MVQVWLTRSVTRHSQQSARLPSQDRLTAKCVRTYVVMFGRLLRGAGADDTRRPAKRQYVYEKRSIEASIELGERVANYLQDVCGQDRATLILNEIAERAKASQASFADGPSAPSQDVNGSQPSPCLPYGFWRSFVEGELAVQFTRRTRMKLWRSVQYYALRKVAGASTLVAMRGTRAMNSCRGSGGP